MIHLVCGPIGAGKTTYSRLLADKHNAILFSEDEWLAKLFVPDAPEGLLEQPMQVVGAWASEKYERCHGQIWSICQQLLKNDINIVLDGAAANKAQRNMIRKKAKDYNTGFQLHYVTAEPDVRHKRVFERNNQQADTYSLDVTQAMFEHTEVFFEAPTGDELTDCMSTRT